ncbi:MAG: protein phosphatase 2C domain-containing protein [Candidatus Bathyarchaeota archaeon]|nr:protein phosphatase 2C domain-containing protein [Candidatus Termiticorpusculum sp.]
MFNGFSYSVQGAGHKERQIVCQDYAAHFFNNKFGMVVVSDGHGSEKHFRSDVGSKIAAGISIQTINDFIAREPDYIDTIFSDYDEILKQLASNLIYRWSKKIHQHFNENPLTEEEQTLYGAVNPEKITYIYGATLIIAVMTKNFWFALQIGDGACVTIIDKDVAKIFVPEDERLVFNFVTSLCDSDAIGNFRYYFSEINEEKPMPLGIIVSSDGVVNSFKEDSFLDFNCKILNLFISQKNASEKVEKFLPILSEKGSKDDASIAGIYFTCQTKISA